MFLFCFQKTNFIWHLHLIICKLSSDIKTLSTVSIVLTQVALLLVIIHMKQLFFVVPLNLIFFSCNGFLVRKTGYHKATVQQPITGCMFLWQTDSLTEVLKRIFFIFCDYMFVCLLYSIPSTSLQAEPVPGGHRGNYIYLFISLPCFIVLVLELEHLFFP